MYAALSASAVTNVEWTGPIFTAICDYLIRYIVCQHRTLRFVSLPFPHPPSRLYLHPPPLHNASPHRGTRALTQEAGNERQKIVSGNQSWTGGKSVKRYPVTNRHFRQGIQGSGQPGGRRGYRDGGGEITSVLKTVACMVLFVLTTVIVSVGVCVGGAKAVGWTIRVIVSGRVRYFWSSFLLWDWLGVDQTILRPSMPKK